MFLEKCQLISILQLLTVNLACVCSENTLPQSRWFELRTVMVSSRLVCYSASRVYVIRSGWR